MERVNVMSIGEKSAQDWTPTQFDAEWPPPITRNGRLRNCAAPACTECKPRGIMVFRGMSQVACRLMDSNKPDLAWPLRACRSADNSRAPRSARQSVRTTACRFVRGSPTCDAPRDLWPGIKALNLPAYARDVAEPHAETSDVLSDEVVALSADLVPRAN